MKKMVKMKMRIKLLLLTFLCCSTVAWAEDVSFTVSAPQVVAVGESFRMTFTLNAEPDNFTAPDLAGFSILAGPSRSSSQSIQIINGQTTQSKSISFVYILQATKEGRITIGAAKATVGGKNYQTRPTTIEVVKGDAAAGNNQQATQSGNQGAAGETDIFTNITFSKSSVYRGEYLIATIKLFTRQMNIAGFEEVKFPTFNGFWSQELEAPQQLQFQRENVNGKVYNTAVIRRYVLFPQQTGPIKVEPFEVTCALQVQGSNQPRSFFDSFFDTPQIVRKRVVSPTPTVQVNALPGGAPASFKGAVGANFRLDAQFNRDSVQANDALNLLIKISGEGNLKFIETPQVNFPPHFETYDVKINDNTKTSMAGISGNKTFEYPVIPRNEGSFNIPGVEFTYFDIPKKQYITLHSKNLHLGVSKDPNAGAATTVAGINRQSVKSLDSDIHYIKTGALTLKEKGRLFFQSTAYWALVSAFLALFIAGYYGLKRHIKKSQDVVFTRNRKANKVAKRRLKTAGQYLKEGNINHYYEELSRAMWGYLTDKTGLDVAGLSRDKAREAMQHKNVNEEDTATFLQVLDECEFARYAPGTGRVEMQKVYDEAMAIIGKLEQVIK